jgi:hypothetical protein
MLWQLLLLIFGLNLCVKLLVDNALPDLQIDAFISDDTFLDILLILEARRSRDKARVSLSTLSRARGDSYLS